MIIQIWTCFYIQLFFFSPLFFVYSKHVLDNVALVSITAKHDTQVKIVTSSSTFSQSVR